MDLGKRNCTIVRILTFFYFHHDRLTYDLLFNPHHASLIPLGVNYWGTDPSLDERIEGSLILPPNPSLMSHQSQQVAHTVTHSVPLNLTGNSCEPEDRIKLERLEWYIPADTSDDIVQELKKLDGSLDLFSINMIKNELQDHYCPEITLSFLTGLQGIRRELLKIPKEHPQGDTRQTIQAVTEREYKFGQRIFYLYRCAWCGAVKRIQRRPGRNLCHTCNMARKRSGTWNAVAELRAGNQ